MGRKKFSDDDKKDIYNDLYSVLRSANRQSKQLQDEGMCLDDARTTKEKRRLLGYVLSDELIDLTNERRKSIGLTRIKINKSLMASALKHGRREFAKGRIKPTQWIMASPRGYFLPKDPDDPRIFAYIVSNFKEINSKVRTQAPLYEYMLRNNPAGLRDAFLKASNGDWEIDDEMNPWAVWNSIMKSNYIKPINDSFDYDEYDWED